MKAGKKQRQNKASPEQLVKVFARKAERGRRTGRRVQKLVDDYFAAPSRRDGADRRRAEDLTCVRVTFKHLIDATGWERRKDLDENLRRDASALVTTTCHGNTPFPTLMQHATKLRGRVNKCGKARNARKLIAGCKPLRLELPLGHTVERLHTLERLASAGRALGNCAKDNGYGLHRELRERHADFYLIREAGDPVALLQASVGSGEITEFLGKSNTTPKLPRKVLVTMLRNLQLNGDNVAASLQQGAHSIFVTGGADVDQPNFRSHDGTVKLWRGTRLIVVSERREWSSFRWEDETWEATDGSAQWRLDGLMTPYPEVASLACTAADPQAGPAA